MPSKSLPCIIDGVRYESIHAAARALRTDFGRVLFRLRSSNFPNYTSKHHTKVKRGKQSIPILCTIKGVEYASTADAAKKLKIRPQTIRNRLRSPKFPDYICERIPKKPPKPPKPPKYSYTVNGKKYRTLQEIGNMEGLTREQIRRKMNSPKYPGYRRVLWRQNDGYHGNND